jgi:hypothetical protein
MPVFFLSLSVTDKTEGIPLAGKLRSESRPNRSQAKKQHFFHLPPPSRQAAREKAACPSSIDEREI